MPKELKWAFIYLNKFNPTKSLYVEELKNLVSKVIKYQLDFEKSNDN